MKCFKKYFSIILIIVFAVIMAVSNTGTYAATQYTGKFMQTEARKAAELINEFRKSNATYRDEAGNNVQRGKLEALEYDSNLERIAMQRAAETVVPFDPNNKHKRPNGQDYRTCTYNGVSSNGENLAWCSDEELAEEVVNVDWREDNKSYENQRHRRIMLGDYASIGLACLRLSNGETFWVAEFGYKVTDNQPAAAVDSEVTIVLNGDKTVAYSLKSKPTPTNAPTTKAPTTKAPTTKAPTTKAPTTKAPTTKAPTTTASQPTTTTGATLQTTETSAQTTTSESSKATSAETSSTTATTAKSTTKESGETKENATTMPRSSSGTDEETTGGKTSGGDNEKSGGNTWIIVVAAVLSVVVIAEGMVIIIGRKKKKEEAENVGQAGSEQERRQEDRRQEDRRQGDRRQGDRRQGDRRQSDRRFDGEDRRKK